MVKIVERPKESKKPKSGATPVVTLRPVGPEDLVKADIPPIAVERPELKVIKDIREGIKSGNLNQFANIPTVRVEVGARGQAGAIITKLVKGKRHIIGQVTVPLIKRLFKWKDGGYYEVDTSKSFMTGKLPYLMFDIDVTEPIELTPTNGKPTVIDTNVGGDKNKDDTFVIHKPIQFNEDVHYSFDTDALMKGTLLAQLIGALNKTAAPPLNFIMTLVIAAAAAAMGYMVGNYYPIQKAATTVVTTTVTTTTHSIIGWLFSVIEVARI